MTARARSRDALRKRNRTVACRLRDWYMIRVHTIRVPSQRVANATCRVVHIGKE
jgi:hypothetical protein